MAGKRYTFVLNFGYAESGSLSYMPWTSTKTYKDAKEALIDLATFLGGQYLININGGEVSKCCTETNKKNPSAKYCSDCGHSLVEKVFRVDNFCDWLVNVGSCNANDLGEYIEYDPDHRWQAGYLEGAPNPRFVYQAEWVLAAAMGHPHQSKTFEEICKSRTKSKKDSFRYY